MCEGLGHFYLNVCFPEESAASCAVERMQEIERSSVCVLLIKSTVTRYRKSSTWVIFCIRVYIFFFLINAKYTCVVLWWRIVRRLL